ncbi:uncharacterized protein LOC120343530 isoform X2 [Styela clava]
MEDKLPGVIEMTGVDTKEKDDNANYDVEMGNCNTSQKGSQKKLWQRLFQIIKTTNRVRPNARNKDTDETQEEFTYRRKSFLRKFAPTKQRGSLTTAHHTNSRSPEETVEYMPSRIWCNRGVVDPEGTPLYIWLGVVTVAWTYSMWLLIVRQAFHELQDDAQMLWLILDYFFDFIYVLDIFVRIRTGYLENGLLVYESGKLAKNYVLSRWFAVDLLSLAPTDIYFLTSGVVQPLLRFPRFFKIHRTKAFARRAESRTSYPNLLRVLNLCHMLMLLMHWFACFYYMISESEGFVSHQQDLSGNNPAVIFIGEERGWAYPLPSNTSIPSPWTGLRRKYLHSLYWACLTLTTIGEKQSPDTDIQYVCTLAAYFLGIFVFATVVGQVGNVIANKNMDRLEFERLVDNAKMFMKTKGVSKDMQNRILRWYDYSWSRGILRGASDVNALGMIPDTLKIELAIRVNMDTLRKVSIFKLVQPEFLYALVLKMRSFVFTPGDLVCRKGEVAREMFIINHGVLNVVNDCGHVVASLGAGDFFGEIGVLNIVNGVNKRVANVVSVGYSEVFSLAGKDVLKAMEYYPEAKNLLLIYGRQRFNETQNSDNNNATEGNSASTFGNGLSSSTDSSASAASIRLRERRKREFGLSAGKVAPDNKDSSKEKTTKKKFTSKIHRRNVSSSQKPNETYTLLSISGAATAVAASVPEGQTIANKRKDSETSSVILNEPQEPPDCAQFANVSPNHLHDHNTRMESKMNYLISMMKQQGSRSRSSSALSEKGIDYRKIVEDQEREIIDKDTEIEGLKKDVQLLMSKLTLSMSGKEFGLETFRNSGYYDTKRKSVTSSFEATPRRKKSSVDHSDLSNLVQKMFRKSNPSGNRVKKRSLTRPKTVGNLSSYVEPEDVQTFDQEETIESQQTIQEEIPEFSKSPRISIHKKSDVQKLTPTSEGPSNASTVEFDETAEVNPEPIESMKIDLSEVVKEDEPDKTGPNQHQLDSASDD